MIPFVTGNLFDLALFLGAALLAWLAYRTRNRALIFVAGVVGGSVGAGVLLFGFLIYPLLLLMALRRPGHGYGWVLLLSLAGGTWLLARRLPLPELLPLATEHATARVTKVLERHSVWSTRRFPGQQVPRPFEEATFDLVLPGRGVLHLRDRVDSGSVPGLRVNASVDVAYPPGRPFLARLAAGERTWARAALVYMLELTAAIAAGLLLLAWLTRPLRHRIDRVLALGNGLAPAAREGVPPDPGRS